MTADGARPLLRRKDSEAFRGRRIGPAKTGHRREHAPHIDALIRLVSVRIVRLAELILRIGTHTFRNRFGVKPTGLRILVILGA